MKHKQFTLMFDYLMYVLNNDVDPTMINKHVF